MSPTDKDETKTSAGQSSRLAESGAVPPHRMTAIPQMEPSPLDDRFRSSLCLEGKHSACEHSALMGICGCECHDWLDELDREIYRGEMN